MYPDLLDQGTQPLNAPPPPEAVLEPPPEAVLQPPPEAVLQPPPEAVLEPPPPPEAVLQPAAALTAESQHQQSDSSWSNPASAVVDWLHGLTKGWL